MEGNQPASKSALRDKIFLDRTQTKEYILHQHKYARSKSEIFSDEEVRLRGYHGCSAEGHVTHVLSARLSFRPMGWSETGAETIARLGV